MNSFWSRYLAGITIAAFATPALAHPGEHHVVLNVAAGFMHTFSGWDHMLAFGATGVWAAQQQRRALLLVVFLLSIAAGLVAGAAGVYLPGLEAGLAASVAVAGLLVAFALRLPAGTSAAMVSSFALLHGFAHGMELPPSASSGTYGIGLLTATALLLLGGIGVTAIFSDKTGSRIVRMLGSGIALTGAYLMVGTI